MRRNSWRHNNDEDASLRRAIKKGESRPVLVLTKKEEIDAKKQLFKYKLSSRCIKHNFDYNELKTKWISHLVARKQAHFIELLCTASPKKEPHSHV